MKKRTICSLLSILFLSGTITTVRAQEKEAYYRSPVGFPVTLAGNVGEIRGERFHMGIDIKALQGVGSPVYAVADGYVSRVGVSPTGYGNVIYISHPNGETSVYGHMDGFVPEIADWVRKQQYAKQSFRVDLYPGKELFPVKKGDRIGSLGNSGSSGGPHLHLEIRTPEGHPRNLIAQGIYKVGDKVDPSVNRVLLFEVDTVWIDQVKGRDAIPVHRLKQSFPVHRNEEGVYVSDSVFRLNGSGYLAYETIDFKDGRTNTMGIYSIRQRVDGVLNLEWVIDYLTYGTTRYAATLTSFAENRTAGRFTVLRAYRSPNNALPIYREVKDRGIIKAPAGADEAKRVETDIVDEAGNVSKVRIQIRKDPDGNRAEIPDSIRNREAVRWNTAFRHLDSRSMVTIPERALFESTLLPFGYDSVRNALQVGLADVPLLKSITVNLTAPEVPENMRNKALLAQVSWNGNGKEVVSSRGGKWEKTGVTAEVSGFGYFRVVLDTVPPVIRPAFKSGVEIPQGKKLRFTVTDDLSGVSRYTLKVDGKWELLAYDPKNRVMEYEPVRKGTPATHEVELTVTDARNNKRTFKGKYTW